MFKKTLATVMPTMIVAMTMTSLAAYAAESAMIATTYAEATVGDDFTIEVAFTEVPTNGISIADFSVDFPEGVKISSATIGSIIPGSDKVSPTRFATNIDNENTLVSVLYIDDYINSENWIKEEGTLLTITGTVSEDAVDGIYSLEFIPTPRTSAPDADSANGVMRFGYHTGTDTTEKYTLGLQPGKLKITGAPVTTGMKGDANCDGVVTVADAVAVAANVANATKNPIIAEGLANSDVHNTGNGLNATDALTIQQYATGILKEL